MKIQHPLTLVIFGATGNLYLDKLAKALFLLFAQGDTLPEDFKVIAFARRDLSAENFRSMTRDAVLKKGEVSADILEKFLSHIEYFQGDFLQVDDFLKLKSVLPHGDGHLTIFHVATAALVYEQIFTHIKASMLHDLGGQVRFMIEKPFGVDTQSALRLRALLDSFLSEEQIFNIDHYLAKETVQAMAQTLEKDASYRSLIHTGLAKVKIIFNESNLVGSRGASYDGVGAFRDVGENHMLEILALVLMQKYKEVDGVSVRDARAHALRDIYIDDSKKITKGQYVGYLTSNGVREDSQTETFFRIFLKSKDPLFQDSEFELEGGKGLVDMHSDITSTTVAVTMYFTDGSMREFKIQPVPGTMYESYVNVYTGACTTDHTLFVSMDEIMSQWRLADELLEIWKEIPLVSYAIGTDPNDIQ